LLETWSPRLAAASEMMHARRGKPRLYRTAIMLPTVRQARPNRKGNSIALENYGKLLSDVRWSSLAMQSVEKRVLLQRIASPQQFEEGILEVGSGVACLA